MLSFGRSFRTSYFPMKILFLDIDGVLNTEITLTSSSYDSSLMGIDPYRALLIGRIVEATGCEIVISSSWRYHPESLEVVKKRVMPFIDVTPMNRGLSSRGMEIKQWLDAHPDVTRYAILDDATDMLLEQSRNFFQCYWNDGLTDEISKRVIRHLNAGMSNREDPAFKGGS